MIRVVRFTKNSKKIIDAKYRTVLLYVGYVHGARYALRRILFYVQYGRIYSTYADLSNAKKIC